ncbi:hypothetical protein BS47DRAFT_1371113 [Hydnum rufescens UP504]|uniref:Choline/carnitine acyltransferase domain-containing protein n=1 Tax=Hydnum rufescens UP504 TaxID=1448309 RepID=A0A9P6B5W7_9AGAM|nr:hypothetical protein BS47DRAFT_1371113 [Hydnum rufescens UP504]
MAIPTPNPTTAPALPAPTFQHQDKLPKLPVPSLEGSARKYLRALEGLQDSQEHQATKSAVEDFLRGEGPQLQQKLIDYAATRDSYIEEFWYESYLNSNDPVVLALNPFFVLEDDPTPSRGSQLPRAASLIISSLGFIHDLRAGQLEPDSVRGTPLDMDQYSRLFGTARIPTDRGCRMNVNPQSSNIVIIRRGQFYYFDVLDHKHRPVLTEREILRNLQAIVADADTTPPSEVARGAVGVLTTENRKHWATLRQNLLSTRTNRSCLEIVDDALFIVCLDDAAPENVSELCKNFLCGTYHLTGRVQTGTCTNRWYDKLQIIVCANGAAGINFEHTGVDGHTVLRFAADIFTDNLLLMARSINPKAPTLFKATLSPLSKSGPKTKTVSADSGNVSPEPHHTFNTVPRKLEWNLTPEIKIGIRFAETRLSDLICQNDIQALEFTAFGKSWITKHSFSPDAFVQMAFQAGYYGLYGRIECTYEPAMTKAFLHGRTEAIRTVQPESVQFTKTFFSDASPADKIKGLRTACDAHVKLTRECGKGLGQDRHLYALYCLRQREVMSVPSNGSSNQSNNGTSLPSLFTDPGWHLLNTSILSTSNCGNPALRLFGFGPVASDGFGIGYIIKEDAISICASSKHLQTRRFLDTIAQYLQDVQRLVMHIHRQANERTSAFVDHSGLVIDACSGSGLAINHLDDDDDTTLGDDDGEPYTLGYSFYDSGEVERVGKRARNDRLSGVGRTLPLAEY